MVIDASAVSSGGSESSVEPRPLTANANAASRFRGGIDTDVSSGAAATTTPPFSTVAPSNPGFNQSAGASWKTRNGEGKSPK